MTDSEIEAEPVTTDPDGTDNSDILHIPYPQNDPQQWVRSGWPEDPPRYYDSKEHSE